MNKPAALPRPDDESPIGDSIQLREVFPLEAAASRDGHAGRPTRGATDGPGKLKGEARHDTD